MLIWRRSLLVGGSFEDERQQGFEVAWQPDMDVFELPDEFVLSLSLPGVRPEDAEVSVVGRSLVIAGERRFSVPPGAIAHQIESPRGRFQRRVRLPANADVTAISSQMSDGQLVLRIAKSAPRSMRVPITRHR
jgi:HSP20 family protein